MSPTLLTLKPTPAFIPFERLNLSYEGKFHIQCVDDLVGSRSRGLGLGLLGVQSIADIFDILSNPQTGTRIDVTMWLRRSDNF